MNKIILCSLFLVIFFVGCSQVSSKTTESSKEKVSNVKILENKQLEVKEVSKEKVEKNDQTVKINLSVLNKGKKADGVGSFEFYLESEGKKIEALTDLESLNGEIEPGKELKGNIYFKVPKTLDKIHLVYELEGEKKVSWDLDVKNAK
ncbi:DUF4352 domain-containing protein [Enterococcus rivorum]|uniref:DUF4352 domain-containing protein n=1 Tax=Enterococcus rivorum TaxID=762845 RepID=A0A1E5KSN6_9ENTE|nr:DUF4352 domain-containing protein [Enterococcus rivorum]MBP2097447.1 hypothetical protein [Enterococcus rivorum]OEH80788.1 hypothetical protein BCR26_07250 [Enterococcus rivorum]